MLHSFVAWGHGFGGEGGENRHSRTKYISSLCLCDCVDTAQNKSSFYQPQGKKKWTSKSPNRVPLRGKCRRDVSPSTSRRKSGTKKTRRRMHRRPRNQPRTTHDDGRRKEWRRRARGHLLSAGQSSGPFWIPCWKGRTGASKKSEEFGNHTNGTKV